MLTNDLLIKLLLFILVFSVTFQSMLKFFKDKIIAVIIGLTTSLIVIFYIPYSKLTFLIDAYGVMGIIVLILIPFIIAFSFIYSSDITGTFRKIFWIFYWIMTILILQNKTNFSMETITITTIVLTLILILILFLDKTIKNKLTAFKNLRRYK